ncbi:MAG: hypothetical protein ACXVPQ_07610 [Bacteroidia bacterium]
MKRILARHKKITVTRTLVKSGPLAEIILPALNHFPKVVKPEEQKGDKDY